MFPKVFAAKDVSEARLAICSTCPDKKEAWGADVCGKCGCLLSAKSKLEHAACPVGKWPKPQN